MRIKLWLGVSVLLLAGCTTTHELTSAGANVRFVDAQPGSDCQQLGEVVGIQSNWFNSASNESSSMRSAANDLRNKAAEIGGNVIYGANSPSENLLASFVPLDSKMTGQVYKCP
ncbi:DUF4156 domain-containing protein [Xenorhabdus szentirmaii]|uniref:Protein with FAD/NAD(P)-binding domain n=2 Tax=Xenorhabdus szentirmaii TaxID=290112 RepID=W1IW61_9GAMM|nr:MULTISPECIES: DUF4156 domain-containing protein [Xenorhabdus]MBD2781599.1 DUF4156 domain-containing protein [Xenorhabdus sp. 38]MBD2791628.1 DUF4156 domain-containing protein [Xenorhabdus sp. CUL]MBD2802148.1 DUF4156 domain-containing protein [Xenorhabdus sp. M]MBD2804735.1 DUF4156 domain-containing protein [Xenorhabdus sp. ZM]MBD2821202.1 DUF4156 domain-containing protein [Xenorhabdus sp. 42]